MKQIFADTLYWVATLTPGDPWHIPALHAVEALGEVQLIHFTQERFTVLIAR